MARRYVPLKELNSSAFPLKHDGSNEQLLNRCIQNLQEGLHLLQHPCNKVSADVASGHLKESLSLAEQALFRQPAELRDNTALVVQLLQLAHQYLGWLLPEDQLQPCMEMDTAASSSTNIRYSLNGTGSSSAKASVSTQKAPCNTLHTASVTLCLQHINFILCGLLQAFPGGDSGFATRPYLVAENATGTLSLLGRVAGAVLAAAVYGKEVLGLCDALFSVWLWASSVAYPCGYGNTTVTYGTAWAQSPYMSSALAAIADLMHQVYRTTKHDHGPGAAATSIRKLVRQLHQLVEGAAQIATGQVIAGRRAALFGAGPSPGGGLLLAGRLRTPVERFLWHAFATATAALQAFQGRATPAVCCLAYTEGNSSSSSSSSGGEGGRQQPASRRRNNLQLTWNQAHDISCHAAAALLELAGMDALQLDAPDPLQQVATGAQHLAAIDALQLQPQPPTRVFSVEVPDNRSTVERVPAPWGALAPPCAPASYLCLWALPDDSPSGAQAVPSSCSNCSKPATGGPQHAGDASGSPHQEGSTSGGLRGHAVVGNAKQATPANTAPPSGSNLLGADSACVGNRLQLLSAALAADWRCAQQSRGLPQVETKLPVGDSGPIQLLMLLAQQLQGAPVEVRAAFLHSPAGSAVLRVLGELHGSHTQVLDVLKFTVTGTKLTTTTEAAHQLCARPGPRVVSTIRQALVERLLLPGLLLQRVPKEASCAASHALCGSSESHGDGSSGRVGQDVDSSNDGDGSSDMGHTSGSSSSSSSSMAGGWGGPVVPPFTSIHLVARTPVMFYDPKMTLGVKATLELVPHTALQLLPGCMPPAQALILTEQLLRGRPSAEGIMLAVQLLRGGMGAVLRLGQQEPQQQHCKASKPPGRKQRGASAAVDKQAGAAELQRLAYCSLASSVVQACVHNQQLGPECAEGMLALAAELVEALNQEAVGGCSSSSHHAEWGLAASLAAAAAAGAYTAHLGAAALTSMPASRAQALAQVQRWHSRAAGATMPCLRCREGTSSTGGAAGAAAGWGARDGRCPADCSVCHSAINLYVVLWCLEQGAALSAVKDPAGMAQLFGAAFVEAAQQRGTTLQQHVQQRLLALAWRHPVQGVCGNVLCGRLEGSAAADVVRAPRGTLCGGCRAAWYCCDGCQRSAWAAHREVCKTSS